jgi:DNA-binding MarR family transcriptional regulator
MCGSFRRTARALTQVYETALRPLGLRATQLTILQVLSLAGEVSQGQLGEMLAMDSTSLTRTLAIMVREGWIAERRGKDQRERWLGLSSGGETKLKRALPVWEKVQSRLRRQLGDRAWNSLLQLTRQVTGLITTKGDSLRKTMQNSPSGSSSHGFCLLCPLRPCTFSRMTRVASELRLA